MHNAINHCRDNIGSSVGKTIRKPAQRNSKKKKKNNCSTEKMCKFKGKNEIREKTMQTNECVLTYSLRKLCSPFISIQTT